MNQTIDLTQKRFVFSKHARERMEQFNYSFTEFLNDAKYAIEGEVKSNDNGVRSYYLGHYVATLASIIHRKYNTECWLVITVYDKRFDLGRKPNRPLPKNKDY